MQTKIFSHYRKVADGVEICEIAFRDSPEFLRRDFRNSLSSMANVDNSGKLQVLSQLLDNIDSENDDLVKNDLRRNQVLIFSMSTTLLDILEAFVQVKVRKRCMFEK